MGVIPRANFKRRNTIMDIVAWIMDNWAAIVDFFDKLSANVLMTGGGLLLVLFVGWSMKKEDYIDELSNGHTNGIPAWLLSTIYYLVKFVAPITIIVVTIANFIL